MIISTTVPVIYSNNKKYYISKGYPDEKQGFVVEVKIEDLPENSNKRVKCVCDSCGDAFSRQYQLLKKAQKKQNNKDLCYSCARKRVGKVAKRPNMLWETDSDCVSKKSEFEKYRKLVVYYTKRQPLHLLENSDKPRTVCGVSGGYQLDHILSIKDGFIRGIEPRFVASLINLRFIPWEENNRKNAKSDMDLVINTFFVKTNKPNK